MKPSKNPQFSPEETQRRFETLLRSAVTTPPKPLKDMPKKRESAKKTAAKSPATKPGSRR